MGFINTKHIQNVLLMGPKNRDRDTEGVKGGKAWGEDVPSPDDSGESGGAYASGSGAQPRPKTGFGAFGAWDNTSDGDKFRTFWQRIFSHIHILLNIKLHCIFVPIIQLKQLSIFFTSLCVLGPPDLATPKASSTLTTTAVGRIVAVIGDYNIASMDETLD